MEKTDLGIVLPLDTGWSDLGSWKSLWEISSDKDNDDKVLEGKVLAKDSKNCYFSREARLIVEICLNNIFNSRDKWRNSHKR